MRSNFYIIFGWLMMFVNIFIFFQFHTKLHATAIAISPRGRLQNWSFPSTFGVWKTQVATCHRTFEYKTLLIITTSAITMVHREVVRNKKQDR
jgi:hypothetical protein